VLPAGTLAVSRTSTGEEDVKRSLEPRQHICPTPIFVVGSYGTDDTPNAMTAAWAGICSSAPPAVTVSIRKSRLSYESILHRRAFTVSIPSEDQFREADYLGLVSGRKGDKFAAAGLTAVPSALVHAPYVGEFPLVFECRLIQTVEVGIHTLFIGEIVGTQADESVLDADGRPDLGLAKPLMYAPGSGFYHSLGPALAKAHQERKVVVDP
jgi:flavin reductase (DIM6/NTAB) family NADH-FMN oxidoreductase RutF